MTTTVSHDVDPVTFEVIRHRLMTITDEQGAALAAISGSPHVAEANDYNVGLYLADGEVATMGRTIVTHSAAMASITRFVIEDCEDDPGFAPGDMFVVNHPWKGAVHAQDMGVVAPIFYGDRILAWSSAMCHMTDVGGSRPGSFCSDAIDCYAEGLQLPPTKVIDRGKVRSDVWNLITSHSRVPVAFDLDLRGLVAANNTAARSLVALADKYGVTTVQTVMAEQIALSDRRLRRRLASLPDAVVQAQAYLDNEGGSGTIYDIALELTKRGDELILDFSKSSPQAPNYINCTRSGLMAAVASALLPTLAYDVAWNAGVFRALTVQAPPGLIISAQQPAPVSGGVLEAGWLAEMTTLECLSKLAACSDELVVEAQGVAAGGPDQFVMAGVHEGGERFTHVVFDCVATGGGAYSHRDGLWTQGQHSIERVRVANAESTELEIPLVYLERGLTTDSGGAGRHRGGLSLGASYVVGAAEQVQAIWSGHGWEVPNSVGIFGGYPGEENDRCLVRGSDALARLAADGQVSSLDDLTGERPVMHGRQGVVRLSAGDAISIASQAGGGYGDPLARSLADVQRDLAERAVSPSAARRLYGAVLTEDGAVDVAASESRRAQLRAERTGWPAQRPLPPQPSGERARVHALGDALELVAIEGARFVSCECGMVLCSAEEPWREHAGCSRSTDITEVSVSSRLAEGLEIRRYACPSCGVLHATDVLRVDAPHPHDLRLLASERG